MNFAGKHQKVERNITMLGVLAFVAVAIGGILEIAPLFWIDSTIEEVEGVRPYTPLELAGRNIYVREGCYNCHSQMIRPFRDEVERYGHYSLAAESMYDRPFQWGSKRTGPDLARVGGRYSDQWHIEHFKDPRSVVPESIMPSYAFLLERDLNAGDMRKDLKALYNVGDPYTAKDIEQANDDLRAQASPDTNPADLQKRYPKAQVRDFDGNPSRLTEADALIAYLQMLGTLVDFESAKGLEQGKARQPATKTVPTKAPAAAPATAPSNAAVTAPEAKTNVAVPEDGKAR